MTVKESICVKNIHGVKSYFDVDVLIKSDDEKTIIIKTWDEYLKKLKYNEKDNCYEVKDEIKGIKNKKRRKKCIINKYSHEWNY